MVTPSLPSPLHRVRSLNLIKAFKKLGYKVFLFSLLVHEEEKGYLDEVRGLVDDWEVVEYPMIKGVKKILKQIYYWPVYPWEYLFLRDQKIVKDLDYFARRVKPDLVYVKRLRTLAISEELIKDYPTLLDTTDVMSKFYLGQKELVRGWQRLISWHEAWGYRRLEERVKDKYPNLNWVTCSLSDAKYLKEQVGVTKIWVWPNVVEDVDEKSDVTKGQVVMFSGLMDKAINYTAALEIINKIWPRVRKKLPKAKLWIVGPRPVSQLKRTDGQKGVRVLGYVKDIRLKMKKARVYLAWGKTVAGTRNKILQAAAWGVPVVAKQEMLQGLERGEGVVVVGEDEKEAAEWVVKLIKDDKLSRQVINRQREWVEKNYSLERLCQVIEKDLKLRLHDEV